MFSIFGYVQQRIMTKNSIFGLCLPILGETKIFLENPPVTRTDGRTHGRRGKNEFTEPPLRGSNNDTNPKS